MRKSQFIRFSQLLEVFSRPGRANVAMILRGYFDESYDSKIFTLSCLISDPKGWAEIERAWKLCLNAKNKVLRCEGRQQLSRYHAADCSSLRGEFSGWSVAEQITFAKELMSTLYRGRAWVNTLSYSMPLEDFVKELNISGDPIPACYVELVKFIMLEIVAQHRDAKKRLRSLREVSFVLFHERCNHDGLYLNAFNAMMNDPTFTGKDLFTTIAPLGWEQCVALQPADMVAYETFKEAERDFTGRNRRKSLEFLMESKRFGGRSRHFQAANLREWRDAMKQAIEDV